MSILFVLSVSSASAQAPFDPATTFQQRCAVCHGATGRGDGAAAQGMRPPPGDLSSARFATAYLSQTIRSGVGGTGMPPGPDLEGSSLERLVAYVQGLGTPWVPVADAQADRVAHGLDLFAIRCASCHGEAGDGQGPARDRVGRVPASFVVKQPTRERIVYVLEEGIAGTAMTPMRRLLSDDELDSMVAFIRSRYTE